MNIRIITDKGFKDNLIHYLLMGAMIGIGTTIVALAVPHIIDLQMYINHGCTIFSNIQPCDIPPVRLA